MVLFWPHDLGIGIFDDVVLPVGADLGEDGAHASVPLVTSEAGIRDEAEGLILVGVAYHGGIA